MTKAAASAAPARPYDPITGLTLEGPETEEERKAKAVAFLRVFGFTSTTCCLCGKQVDSQLEQLLQCARCKLAHYCGMRCVQKDFEAHRPTCLLAEAFGRFLPDEEEPKPVDDNKKNPGDDAAPARRRPKPALSTQSLEPPAVEPPPPTAPRKIKSLYAKPAARSENDDNDDNDHDHDDGSTSKKSRPKVKQSKSAIGLDSGDTTPTPIEANKPLSTSQKDEKANASPKPPAARLVRKATSMRVKSNKDDDAKHGTENTPQNNDNNSPCKDNAMDPPTITPKKVRKPLRSHKSCVSLDGGLGARSLHSDATADKPPPRPKLRRNKSAEEDKLSSTPAAHDSATTTTSTTSTPSPAPLLSTPVSSTPVASDNKTKKSAKPEKGDSPAANNDTTGDDDHGKTKSSSSPTTTTKKVVRKPLRSHKSMDALDAGGTGDGLHDGPDAKPPRPNLKRVKSLDDGHALLPKKPDKPTSANKPKRIELDLHGLPKRADHPDDTDSKRRDRNHLSGGRMVVVTEGNDVQSAVRKLMANDGQCCYCGKVVPKPLMLQCARCKLAYYCKMNCVNADFDQHRAVCNFIVEYKDYSTIVAVDHAAMAATLP